MKTLLSIVVFGFLLFESFILYSTSQQKIDEDIQVTKVYYERMAREYPAEVIKKY